MNADSIRSFRSRRNHLLYSTFFATFTLLFFFSRKKTACLPKNLSMLLGASSSSFRDASDDDDDDARGGGAVVVLLGRRMRRGSRPDTHVLEREREREGIEEEEKSSCMGGRAKKCLGLAGQTARTIQQTHVIPRRPTKFTMQAPNYLYYLVQDFQDKIMPW